MIGITKILTCVLVESSAGLPSRFRVSVLSRPVRLSALFPGRLFHRVCIPKVHRHSEDGLRDFRTRQNQILFRVFRLRLSRRPFDGGLFPNVVFDIVLEVIVFDPVV